MRRYAMFVGVLLVLTSVGTAVTAEPGWDNPLAVFITVPDVEWDVGSEITVTVHVFNEGAYYDPDDVNLTMGEEYKEVNLTKVDTGLYTGTFTVMEEDLDWDGDIVLEAAVTDGIGPLPDMAEDYTWLESGGGGGPNAERPTRNDHRSRKRCGNTRPDGKGWHMDDVRDRSRRP